MTILKSAFIATALILSANSGMACTSLDPCTRGELIDFNKMRAQEAAGAKNGFGQRVSDSTRNGSVSGAKNLGQYLQENAVDQTDD